MSQSFYKSKKKSRLCDKNSGKCGDITFCLQVGKRVYALNCLFCPQICIQWDAFINHMEEEHDEELRSDHLLQQEIEEVNVDTNNSKETAPKLSSEQLLEELPQSSQMCIRTEINDSASAEAFLDYDDPLTRNEGENCSKTENYDYAPDQAFEIRVVNAAKSDQTCDSIDEQLFRGYIDTPTKPWPVQTEAHANDVNKKYFPDVARDAVISEINLHKILDCFRGRSLITYYQSHNCLDTPNRRALCDLIIDEVFNKGWRLRLKDLPYISQKIVDMFPTEDLYQYFIPREASNKRTPTGFFFHRYYNRIKGLKDRPVVKRKRIK